jgi:hypothetical protein
MPTSSARTAYPTLAAPATTPAEAPRDLPTAPASRGPAAGAVDGPIRELLAWIARRPRTYAEAMEAWQSHCPRYTLWEDALEAKLIRIERGDGMRFGEARVSLTPRGQAALESR